jgi:hypothetical protein
VWKYLLVDESNTNKKISQAKESVVWTNNMGQWINFFREFSVRIEWNKDENQYRKRANRSVESVSIDSIDKIGQSFEQSGSSGSIWNSKQFDEHWSCSFLELIIRKDRWYGIKHKCENVWTD